MIRDAIREFGNLLLKVLPYFGAGLVLTVGFRRWAPSALQRRRWTSGPGVVYQACIG